MSRARAEIEIRSDLTELRKAREFVRTFCRDLLDPPMGEDHVAALELGVNEAVSNIMRHAYHGREGQWIRVEAEAFPGYVSVMLHHLGDPFVPGSRPTPPDNPRESGNG